MADLVGHKEYSSEGKIDPAGIDMNQFRRDAQAFINGTAIGDDDTMNAEQAKQLYQVHFQTALEQPVRQVFQKTFYNIKDGKFFTRAGLADMWNELVWDGYINPVDVLDGRPDPDIHPAAPDRARRGSLMSYVLATYREAVIANRRAAAFVYALEQQGVAVNKDGLHLDSK